jgi:zinc transport system permease protein
LLELLRSIPILSHLLLAESHGMSFLDALPIVQNGLLASCLTAVVCSFLGIYILLKRMVFVSAALTQFSALGIALALILTEFFLPQGPLAASTHSAHDTDLLSNAAALLFACLVASGLAVHTQERRITRESLLGIGYVLPAGLSLVILDRVTTHPGLIEGVLFGNAVFVTSQQLLMLALACTGVLCLHGLLYKEFVFTSFDPETAKASGLRTLLLNQLLFFTLAVSTSVAIGCIGALPVFAFMVIPAAAALLLVSRLPPAFLLAMGIGVTSALAGFYLSFLFALPTGPTMIATAGLFLVPGFFVSWWGR